MGLMKLGNGTVAIASAVAVALAVAPASAKDRPLPPSPLLKGLRDCQAVRDGAARLACYDKAGGAMIRAADGGDVAIVDRESLNSARRSLFGFALPSLPFLNGGSAKQPTMTRLESTVTSFRSLGNGFYRIGIADSNAVWESTEAANLGDANPGEQIVISRGAIGSYFAKIGKQREVRVRRVR